MPKVKKSTLSDTPNRINHGIVCNIYAQFDCRTTMASSGMATGRTPSCPAASISWACIRGGTQRGPAPSTDLSIVKIVVTACRASHIVHRAHRCPARFTECSFFTRSSSTVSTILCCGHDTFPSVISSPISVRTNVPLWQYRLGAERGC